MSSQITSDHPKQKLIFYIAQDFGEDIPPIVQRVVGEIARGRNWLIGPPQFIDEIHTSNLGTSVRTVGGVLLVYSALPPWKLPIDTDRQHLEEVTWLVEALRQFSGEHNLAIEFELDGTFVGAVEDGRIDRTLAEGLLGEWRRELDQRTNS
ncbi:hypothetical protein M2103_001189 [Ereboglobus sp. PH5-5]|uniref:hypothetical protein n=1 Tax=Ereboglobus sp. PH5-5 TaxID=2940529 RepID=UPI002405E6B2|nr:hypothetical protein [Ereboglobus sp. PH5-5]MDF9832972.1 hypothetical protein [Ereboglobus sp. PH5-5]